MSAEQTQTTPAGSNDDPLAPLDLRYHHAIPGWCRVIGLQIRAVPECEGGGYMIRQDQAERLIKLLNDAGVP